MDYEVSDIATKVLSIPEGDEDGYVELAIKATVKNNLKKKKKYRGDDVGIELQGVDAEGFEVDTVYLEGTIPLGGTRTLTTREPIKVGLHKQIARWQQK